MDNAPFVSVLMTAYNREKLIAESIESVLSSSYKHFELIIVDDGSDDNTIKIVNEYAAKDHRIKVYQNEKNLGDYPNRNRAANYAKGKYLKYVDSDDKLYPAGLKYCVECMEAHPEADWGIIFPEEIAEEYLLDSKQAIQSHFFEKPFLKAGPGQTILKKDFFMKLDMYPVLYGPANDMYFNLQAAIKGNVLVLKDNFLFYRRHEAQEQSNRFSYLYNNSRYLKDALEKLDLPLDKNQINWLQKKRKRRFSVNLVNYFFETGNLRQIKQACHKAGFSFKDFLVGIFHFAPRP